MPLLPPEDAASRLLPVVSKAKGRMTVADGASATGLALEDARSALEHLMSIYSCRLQVTESGEILYDFGGTLQRRGEMTMRERVDALLDALWKLFTVVFKIWITVTLVVYFVIFVVLVIALLIASQGRDSKRVRLSWIGDLFIDLFVIRSRMAVVYSTDAYGYRHRAMRQKSRTNPEQLEPKKRLVQSVYDFVFGPPRPDFDPFANEKEVLAWLRANKGLLTPTEIVALAGVPFEIAERRMADYLTRFHGDADITDDGVLVGRFRNVLMQGDAALDGGAIELFWDEYEAPYEITGNGKTRNAVIIGMNSFNLLFSLIVLSSSTLRDTIGVLSEGIVGTGVISIGLGWIPFLFSLIFFIVPIVRAVRVRRAEADRIERNKRRRVVRVIFDTAGYEVGLADVVAAVNRGSQAAMKDAEIARILTALVSELHGSVDLREDGSTVYRFDRLQHEAVAARRVRADERVEGTGDVIFDTAG